MTFRVGANGNNGAANVGGHDAHAFNKMMHKQGGGAGHALQARGGQAHVHMQAGGGADYQSFYAKFAKQLDASTVDFSSNTGQIGQFKAQIQAVIGQLLNVTQTLQGIQGNGQGGGQQLAHCGCGPVNPTPTPPTPEVDGPVEVTQGKIWGDPHFVGADGGKYDVQGEAGKTYNILSDKGVQMNAKFSEWRNPGTTVVDSVGIVTDGHTVEVDKSGGIKINGEGVAFPAVTGQDFDLPHGLGTKHADGSVTIKAGEYDIKLSDFRTDHGGWINKIEFRSDDANSDKILPSGLWGASVDGDGQARNGDKGKGTQGGGAIENLDGEITERGDKTTVKQYEVGGLLDTQFDNFNVFAANGGNRHVYGPELITNGGFENHGDLNRGTWGTLDQIAGWNSKHGQFEIQEGPHGGTPNTGANNAIVELDAHGHESNGGIEQTVNVDKAGVHELTFDYSPRQGPNGIEESSKMHVVVNGQIVDTISSDTVGFEQQTLKLNLPAGENKIAFVAAGTEDTYGALLDNVSLKRAPDAQQPPHHCHYPPVFYPPNVNVNVDINIDVDINIFNGGVYHGPDQTPAPEMDPIAVDNGRVWGDPHFVGADGGKYDVQGEAGKTYSLLSDQGLQVNAMFDQWRGHDDLTMVRDVGVSLGNDQIGINGDGTVTINGENVQHGEYLDGAVKVENGRVIVQDNEYNIEFKQSGGYVNDIFFKAENAVADGVLPHGLWGVTVDGDGEARNGDQGKGTQGGGAIEGLDGEITEKGDKDAVKLYEVGGLFDTEFNNFNKFDAAPENGGGFEGWLNGNAFQWISVGINVDVDVNITSNYVNTPMMNYGLDQITAGMETLRPMIQNVGTVGAMNEVQKLLTLMSQLLDMIQMSTNAGNDHTAAVDARGDAAAALEQLGGLEALLMQLQGIVNNGGAPVEPAPLPEMKAGEWFANHGGYKKNDDGSYSITKGEHAGYTLRPTEEDGKFTVFDEHNCAVGIYNSKNGADKVASPIAFDMNGDGKIGVTGETTAKDGERAELGRTVEFDIDGDGTDDKIEWMAGDGDALLVDNRDGNAANDMDGARLFGDQGGKFTDGYQKLAQLDTNGDNVLTAGELQGLMLWRDNGNAKVDAGEMISAADAGVTSISTQRNDVTNERGETLMRSAAEIAGEEVMTEDVWFGQED